jgi:hypothetical protein
LLSYPPPFTPPTLLASSCCYNKINQIEGHGSYHPLLCSKKTKEEGDGSKAVIAFLFFLLQQNKTKRRGRQLSHPSAFQKKPKKEGNDNFAVIAFFFLLQ